VNTSGWVVWLACPDNTTKQPFEPLASRRFPLHLKSDTMVFRVSHAFFISKLVWVFPPVFKKITKKTKPKKIYQNKNKTKKAQKTKPFDHFLPKCGPQGFARRLPRCRGEGNLSAVMHLLVHAVFQDHTQGPATPGTTTGTHGENSSDLTLYHLTRQWADKCVTL